ncbi:TadE family type IV pilus minor pilin [Tsukamurella soli]|uniref:TadE family type IV pilus minor pilin n=1 Tax=Tsukamurella soli TaxID=644556 RepID=UPI0031EF206D
MTVEAALAIGSLVVVLIACIGAVTAMTSYVRCVDAAREGARLHALGDAARASSAVAAVAPGGASSSVSRDDGAVTVRVSADVPLLPGLTVTGVAVAATEPGLDGE